MNPLSIEKILQNLAYGGILLLVFVLGIKSFREPDLWWMLRTGEWIVANGAIPRTDPFSFTFPGTPWINVKWLFEILIYYIQKISSPEWIIAIQAVVNVAVLVLLLESKKHFSEKAGYGAFLWALVWMLSVEFRMTGRPEMMSHLFTALYLLVLCRHEKKPDRLFWLLVPLQALWANFHEGYGVGYIILLAFFLDALLHFKKKRNPVEQLAMPIVAVLAVAFHPYGIQMIWHPLEIFGQLGENKFTVELYSMFTGFYWAQLQSWIFAFSFLLGTILVIILAIKKGKEAIQSFPAWYLLMCLLFAYLGTTAHRNIPFFMIWSFPLIAWAADGLFVRLQRWRVVSLAAGAVFILTIAMGYYGIVSNRFYEAIGSKGRFGLFVPPSQNPIGAADFIESQGLSAKTAFSDFLVSSYLMWELRSGFKTYIDFRDLDVFPPGHFQRLAQMGYYTSVFDQDDGKYHFDYAVIYRPQFSRLHAYLAQSEKWKVAFIDPVAVVYIKDSTGNPKEDAYKILGPPIASKAAMTFNHILGAGFFEPDRPMNEHAIAAGFYSSIGYDSLALVHAEMSTKVSGMEVEGYVTLGETWLQTGNKLTGPQQRHHAFVQSSEAFTKAFQLDKNSEKSLQGLAQLAMAVNDPLSALQYINRGIGLNHENPSWYLLSAQANGALSMVQSRQSATYVQAYIDDLKHYLELNPDDVPVKSNLALTLCQLGRCDEAREFLEGESMYPGMPSGDREKLERCKQRCGA